MFLFFIPLFRYSVIQLLNMSYTKIILKEGKEENLKRFHPWIFSGAIKKIIGKVEEGDIVEILDSRMGFQGLGHYQIGSIAVRMLAFNQVDINSNFWNDKIRKAYQVRVDLGLINETNNTFRLIHGEGDSLPGLIIDIYDHTAIIQAHSVGMHHARFQISEALKTVLGSSLKSIYYKSEATLPFKANIEPEDGYLYGSSGDGIAMENNLKFLIDWEKGQKTGFFIDQRENRSLLEKYSKGRQVLNMFCYTGGFSCYAMRGGARYVDSVDSSAKAIEITNKNIALNFLDDNRHQSHTTDAFRFLDNINEKYDLIVLDPPAFAKHKDVLRNALQGYRKLNAKAFEQIKPGGILFTFSCSQAVSKEQFRLAVFSAAAQSGRNVRILHQLSQPADHPINIYHPEGEYLKGLVLYVE